jgi:hypothetical protein
MLKHKSDSQTTVLILSRGHKLVILICPRVSVSLVTFGQLDIHFHGTVHDHPIRGHVTLELQFNAVDIYLKFCYDD